MVRIIRMMKKVAVLLMYAVTVRCCDTLLLSHDPD